MAAHHSRILTSLLSALVVTACGGDLEIPTASDAHGNGAIERSPAGEADPAPPAAADSTGAKAPAPSSPTSLAPAPGELCSELLNAAPRGSLAWEERQPHGPEMSHPYLSILAHARSEAGPDGQPRHKLELVASTVSDPEAWAAKGIRPSTVWTWTVVLSGPASPGVGAYVDPDVQEYHGGATMTCDGQSGGGGSSTGSPTSTVVTITERTPTVVRGVIETEWDRVTFEAPISAQTSSAGAAQLFCCVESTPASD